jgi:hypothetical protein
MTPGSKSPSSSKLTLSKETLKNLVVRSGLKTGREEQSINGNCPVSDGCPPWTQRTTRCASSACAK